MTSPTRVQSGSLVGSGSKQFSTTAKELVVQVASMIVTEHIHSPRIVRRGGENDSTTPYRLTWEGGVRGHVKRRHGREGGRARFGPVVQSYERWAGERLARFEYLVQSYL